MRLYHGSTVIVSEPRIFLPEPGRKLDFGHGFYTTSDYDQAGRWARGLGERKRSAAFVSVFDVPDNLLNLAELKVLSFESASHAWLDFVVKNRMGAEFVHDYDIVAGPVANDKVFATIALFEDTFLSADQAIENLKTYELVDQFLFHSEKSLQYLIFIESRAL